LAKVAGGDGDGTLTFRSIHEWDVCAGVFMVEEAGGKVLDSNGKRLTFNQQDPRHHGLVAANGTLAEDMQGLVAKVLTQK
jgi:myo-inositol-1(or 4)-monophosphatase